LGFSRKDFVNYICPGWLQTTILLISASGVARITGMSHGTQLLIFLSICSVGYLIPCVSAEPWWVEVAGPNVFEDGFGTGHLNENDLINKIQLTIQMIWNLQLFVDTPLGTGLEKYLLYSKSKLVWGLANRPPPTGLFCPFMQSVMVTCRLDYSPLHQEFQEAINGQLVERIIPQYLV
jgi:hypothetical protein